MPKKFEKPGDCCDNCFQVMTQWSWDEATRRKIKRAHNATAKAKANGTRLGMKRKVDYEEAARMKASGMSVHEIAKLYGVHFQTIYNVIR